jgi:hypothetical protein
MIMSQRLVATRANRATGYLPGLSTRCFPSDGTNTPAGQFLGEPVKLREGGQTRPYESQPALYKVLTRAKSRQATSTTTTIMTLPQLAPELVHGIMDESSNDRDTLKAFAVVCRAWTDHAQKRIFHSILITGPWTSHPTAEAGTLRALCNFLETHPHLQPHVHELSFNIAPVGRARARMQPAERARISALLPRVHTVVALQLWVDLALLSSLPALRTLRLHNCCETDDLVFSETGVRSCVRGLHDLRLHYGNSALRTIEDLQRVGALASLRKVELMSRSAEDYGKLLSLLDGHDRMRELSLNLNYGPFYRSSACKYSVHTSAICRSLFADCASGLPPIDAPALVSLRLVCDPDIDAAQIIFTFLTRSSLPSLLGLHLHVDASLVGPLPAAVERNVEAQKTRLTLPRGVVQQLAQVAVKLTQT